MFIIMKKYKGWIIINENIKLVPYADEDYEFVYEVKKNAYIIKTGVNEDNIIYINFKIWFYKNCKRFI